MNLTRLFLKDRKILLRVAKKSDYDKALQFLRKHFYPYDDLSKGNTQSQEDEEIEMQSIDSGTSILAETDDHQKELIGVALSRAFREDDSRKLLKRLQNLSDQCERPNDLDAIIFLEELKLRSQVCQRFNVDKACYAAVIGIHENFRRLGLGNILTKNKFECAAKMGFSVAFSIAVTNLGAALNKSVAFQQFYSMKFVDYKDYRGRHVFSHFPPEAMATVGFKILELPANEK